MKKVEYICEYTTDSGDRMMKKVEYICENTIDSISHKIDYMIIRNFNAKTRVKGILVVNVLIDQLREVIKEETSKKTYKQNEVNKLKRKISQLEAEGYDNLNYFCEKGW